MAKRKEKITFEEFYAATGEANSWWYSVEDAMRDLFSRLLIISIAGSVPAARIDAHFSAGAVFFCSTNMRSRLEMIDLVLSLFNIKDDSILSKWEKLKKSIWRSYGRRNIIAHGAVYGNADGASIVMTDVYRPPKTLNYHQVVMCRLAFELLGKRLRQFAIEVDHYLVPLLKKESSRTIPPPERSAS